jgi:hypothetical protein
MSGSQSSAVVDPNVTPPVTPPVPPAAKWYEGKVAPEHIGLWQNKYPNVSLDDPAAIADAITKSYAEAQKHFGAPPDELVRFPKNPADPAYDAIRTRLGVPATPADYDMTTFKRPDGTPLDAAFEQAMREAAHASGVAKDRIANFMTPVLKFLDGQETNAKATREATVLEQKAALAKSWGANDALNKFTAQQGAAKLGFTLEEIAAMEGSAGYAKVMEAMRRVGASELEDSSPSGDIMSGSAGKIVTMEQALARKAELKGDKGWVDRFLAGGANEKREMLALDTMIASTAGGR